MIATERKERPILFSAPMVRRILAGEKTQTRRVVKLPPLESGSYDSVLEARDGSGTFKFFSNHGALGLARSGWLKCPYGKVGDHLWVREAHFVNYHPADWKDFSEDELRAVTYYRADYHNRRLPDFEGEENEIRWRPSIHMPRWASRLTLEITNLRVERLQGISHPDIIAEGLDVYFDPQYSRTPYNYGVHKTKFEQLWNSINGHKEGCLWEDNPFVWVIEFKQVTP